MSLNRAEEKLGLILHFQRGFIELLLWKQFDLSLRGILGGTSLIIILIGLIANELDKSEYSFW